MAQIPSCEIHTILVPHRDEVDKYDSRDVDNWTRQVGSAVNTLIAANTLDDEETVPSHLRLADGRIAEARLFNRSPYLSSFAWVAVADLLDTVLDLDIAEMPGYGEPVLLDSDLFDPREVLDAPVMATYPNVSTIME